MIRITLKIAEADIPHALAWFEQTLPDDNWDEAFTSHYTEDGETYGLMSGPFDDAMAHTIITHFRNATFVGDITIADGTIFAGGAKVIHPDDTEEVE